MPLVAAFDTATAFALSVGIAKFQLAQARAKLVGEIVSREGRSEELAPGEHVEGLAGVPRNSDLRSGERRASLLQDCRSVAGPSSSEGRVSSQ